MDVGDIIQLRVQQRTPNSNTIENVFFYVLTAGDGSLQSIADSFWATVASDWKALCNANHVFEIIFARNLFNDAEFYNLSLNETGTALGNIGEPLPDFVALDVRFPRQAGNIRDGRKRFTCGGEGVLDSGDWNNAWLSTFVLPFIEHLNNTIQDPNTDPDAFYNPIIVKRIFTGLSPKGRRLYRLPENAAEADYYTVVPVLASGTPTSQVSRK